MQITKVKLYMDGKGEYRLTVYAANGEPIFVSSEGYVRKEDAREAASVFPDAQFIDATHSRV